MSRTKLKASIFKAVFVTVMLIIYKTFFGNYDVAIGMILALSCIAFLKFDFTLYPIYKTASFICLNLFLLVMSFLSGINPFLGFIINLITIFIVSYSYMDTSKNMVSYLFTFVYIFMISIPVPYNLLPKRFMSLLFGILVIMVSQFIFNKNKFKSSCTNLISNSLNNIIKEINDIIQENTNKKDNILIYDNLRNLLLFINNKNSHGIFSKGINEHYFNIAVILERLADIIKKIDSLHDKSFKTNYLIDLKFILSDILKITDNKEFNINHKLLGKYINSEDKHSIIYECNNLIDMLYVNIEKLDNPSKMIKADFKKLLLDNISINFNSLRFNFSIKMALAISISMFFIDEFNLSNGRWLLITIYVLIQPFNSDTIVKTKKRIKGTLIGVSLFILIFGIFQPKIPSIIFILLLMLIYFYATDYYIKVASTCVLALSINLASNNLQTLSILRFSFIFIGAIISILFSKYFLPFSKINHLNELKNRYLLLSSKMVSELNEVLNDKYDISHLKKLSLDCNTIESTLLSLLKNTDDTKTKRLIYTEYKVISHIRFSTLSFYNDKLKRSLP